MADKLAVIQSTETINELKLIESSINDLIGTFETLEKKTSSISNGLLSGKPKEFASSYKVATDAIASYNRVSSEANSINAQIEKTNKKISDSLTYKNQLLVEEKVKLQQVTKANKEYAAEKIRLENLSEKEKQRLGNTLQIYTAVEKKMQKLQLEYRNLAVAKEMGVKLTDKEVQRMDYLKGRIEKYDTTLKAVDATMGKHTRHVGNYERANNGLGMSLAQITREMPAFANSAQTGFMALSNNIPIFFDAIGQVKNLNKELQAQGKPTVSVLKQVAGALFSWQTALSVGVTLLTVYGADIVKWGQKVLFGASSLDSMEKAQKGLNKAISEGTKGAASEISQLNTLLNVAKDTALSYDQRLKAVKKLQEIYPSYFGNISTENIMLGKTKDAYLELRKAIIASSQAKAIESILSERQGEFLLEEEKTVNNLAKTRERISKLQEAKSKGLKKVTIEFDNGAGAVYSKDEYDKAIQNLKNYYSEQLSEFMIYRNKFLKNNEYIMKKQAKLQDDASKLEADRIKDPKTPKEKKPKTPKEKKDDTLDQYKIEQDRIEKLFKVREDAIKNEIELIKKDPFLNPVEKIIKEGEAYDKLIKLNQDYYGALIENAKNYKQNTLDFETSRDIKAGDLSKSKEDAFLGMPGAMSEQIDYVNKLTESTKALNYEEAKNKILNDKRLSVSQREYLLSQLEIDRQIEILETNKRNLQIYLQNLEAKERTNNLTRQEKSDLAQIRIENEAITNEIDRQNQLKKQNENQKLISDLTPLRNVVSDGLQGLGLGEISDEFDNLFVTVLDKQSTFLEKFNAGFQLIGEYGKILVEQQTQRQIEALDQQLEASRNATEQELGFIDKRLEYYSNMEELTAEQIADRNALEDEARTYREQQEEREKLIAIQKAKAEQRASANKAIIGGLQGAAMSIANLGLPVGLPFAVASTAMGAVMAALIMSKNPVPQYFVGRSGGKAEFALTQERGAEAIISKDGEIKTFGDNKGAQMTWLDEGDSVLTADKTKKLVAQIKDMPDMDSSIYRKIAKQGIMAPIIMNNNIDNSDAIAEKVGKEFDKVMSKYDKEYLFEKDGMIFSQKGGQIPILVGRAKKNKIEIKVNRNGRD